MCCSKKQKRHCCAVKEDDFEDPAQEPEIVQKRESWERITIEQGKVSLKDRLIFWSIAASGIAVGTVLFLFFLTLFLYVFLPLALILLLWNLIKNKKTGW